MLNLFRGMEKGNIVLNSRKYDGICKNYGRKIKKYLHRTPMYGVQRNREVFRMKYVKRTKTAKNVGFVLFCILFDGFREIKVNRLTDGLPLFSSFCIHLDSYDNIV